MKQKYAHNSTRIDLGGEVFFFSNGELWGTTTFGYKEIGCESYKIKNPQKPLCVSGKTYCVKVNDREYVVDEFGYDDITPISYNEILQDILSKVNMIEFSGTRSFILTKDKRIDVGCLELRDVLYSKNALKTVHKTDMLELCEIVRDNIKFKDLKKYAADIKRLHNDLK